MHFAILLLAPLSFVLAAVFTWTMRSMAPRLGFVDKPGHRKIHHNPKPLGGGVAIFWALVLPMIVGLLIVNLHQFSPNSGHSVFDRLSDGLALHQPGIRHETRRAVGLLACLLGIHIMGLFDDRQALGPYLKLGVQLAVAAVLVIACDLRALTFTGPVMSTALSILWIVGITNAFNFLDNMDGLSAGVGAVASFAFLIATLTMPQPQWFVAAVLALLLGALLGFLIFNFSPASIFMGDSGSLVIGLILGALTIRTTYLPPGHPLTSGWYAVFAPLIVLAVPLYDLVVVSAIRLRNGKSPFVGDTNHLSHRLVARGMSRRTAVLCIYLMTAATSIAAILLAHVDTTLGGLLILSQTLLVVGLVALLEQHPIEIKDANRST